MLNNSWTEKESRSEKENSVLVKFWEVDQTENFSAPPPYTRHEKAHGYIWMSMGRCNSNAMLRICRLYVQLNIKTKK